MMGRETDSIGYRVFMLGAFWAPLAVLARAGFSAIDLHASWRRAASLGLFLPPVVVTVTGLAIGRAETAVIGIFLLAAVVCAALLPPERQLTERQLVVLPLVIGAGIIGIYPVALALARPTLAGLRASGAPLPMIFAVAGVVAIVAGMGCARLNAFGGEHAGQLGSSWAAQRGTPAATRSDTLTVGSGATADRHLPSQDPPPPHARPSTAVELPRQKPANHENEDQPRAQPEPRRQ
jgi:hypothetical protein